MRKKNIDDMTREELLIELERLCRLGKDDFKIDAINDYLEILEHRGGDKNSTLSGKEEGITDISSEGSILP